MLDSWGRPSRRRVTSTPWLWPTRKEEAWSRVTGMGPRYRGGADPCSGRPRVRPDVGYSWASSGTTCSPTRATHAAGSGPGGLSQTWRDAQRGVLVHGGEEAVDVLERIGSP